ncbi:MAG: hypothetical protein OIN85_08495 [Candidatus Methanoperedens sp.]|nr:hypothetical protein [Candidatus Methanoperedens sp.]
MESEKSISYSDNPNFNKWLDSNEDNIVSIAGYSFSPSETLYRMNYERYCEESQLYLNDDSLLLEEIYSDFPTPIAFYLYQAQENYDNPHHRLDLLKSTWESLVFVLYGVVVGEARHKKLPLKETGLDPKDYYSDRLAVKLKIVENILDLCKKKGYSFKSLDILAIDIISKLNELNRKRNEFEHSFAATPDQQCALYNELLPEMITALKLIRDLQKVSLFRFHSNSEGGTLLPRCDVFRGHSLDGAKKILNIKKEDFDIVIHYFNKKSIFCHIEDDVIFCLSPFIHFTKEVQDIHPKLLFFKKKLAEGKYLYEIVSQATQIKLDKIEFKDRDDEIRKLVMEEAA